MKNLPSPPPNPQVAQQRDLLRRAHQVLCSVIQNTTLLNHLRKLGAQRTHMSNPEMSAEFRTKWLEFSNANKPIDNATYDYFLNSDPRYKSWQQQVEDAELNEVLEFSIKAATRLKQKVARL